FDPLNPIQVRSQTALHPDTRKVFYAPSLMMSTKNISCPPKNMPELPNLLCRQQDDQAGLVPPS
ncbi:hypothetical protein, partial [Desulfovibrio sp.]|uniref:hypothetical protein n=1 Tax=Desulfovibrio sp. TaxID=885 RepID=UPI003FF11FFF